MFKLFKVLHELGRKRAYRSRRAVLSSCCGIESEELVAVPKGFRVVSTRIL